MIVQLHSPWLFCQNKYDTFRQHIRVYVNILMTVIKLKSVPNWLSVAYKSQATEIHCHFNAIKKGIKKKKLQICTARY